MPMWSFIFGFLSFTSLILSIVLLIKSKWKLQEIKEPLQNITWNQSYCKLTLHLVYVVIVAQWLNIIIQSLRTFSFALSGHLYQMFEYRGDQITYCIQVKDDKTHW